MTGALPGYSAFEQVEQGDLLRAVTAYAAVAGDAPMWQQALYLPISPGYLPYISGISRVYLRYISPICAPMRQQAASPLRDHPHPNLCLGPWVSPRRHSRRECQPHVRR